MDVFNKAKGLLDVVTGGNITGQTGELVWKYPYNIITSGSILQVTPTQDAVFMKGGGDFEIFEGPQEIIMDTKALPFLQKVMNIPFAKGKKTPYSAHIWFVNKTVLFKIKWGTPNPILLKSAHDGGMMLPILANGAFRIKVIDTRSFFMNVVGTAQSFTLENLRVTLKEIITAKIDGIMRRYAQQVDKSFLELGGDNDDVARLMWDACKTEFERYGIGIDGSDALVSLDTAHKNFQRLEEKEGALYEAYQRRQERDIEGYTYLQERQLDVSQALAENESNVGASVAGLGVGLGMMGAVAGQVQNVLPTPPPVYQPQGYVQPVYPAPPPQGYVQQQVYAPPQQVPVQPPSGVACPSCGIMQNPAKFCNECGSPMEAKCPSCGVKIEHGKKFCGECGTKLG